MEKDHLNDKVLDKEKALSVIKTSYLNSYKVIVAGARDFADYAYMKKKQKTSVNNLRHFLYLCNIKNRQNVRNSLLLSHQNVRNRAKIGRHNVTNR